ncbi:MAG TPA: S8 family peptidase [Novosphingobium sp.]|nr:S8 family peptidase [Novosphingobium sp.]
MADGKKDDQDRISLNLARYIVSPAVLQTLRAEGGAEESPAEPRAPTIVELNINYPGGVKGASEEAVAWLRDEGVDPADIDAGSSIYNVFANLAERQLHAIEERVRAARPTPIFRIWPDDELKPLMNRSVRTIKGDACFTVYRSSGEEIVWAVADSGVDERHLHFQRHATTMLEEGLSHRDFTGSVQGVGKALEDAYGHGTHVAGIIAGETRLVDERPADGATVSRVDVAGKPEEVQARRLVARRASEKGVVADARGLPGSLTGVAPLAKIMSLKVLDDKGNGRASNLIAALEYLEEVNTHGRLIRVHGVNLSVGYSFDAELFAAGHSPLCTAVNRLARSGVVVVAAAGNDGAALLTPEGRTTGKRIGLDQSINDPGNAEMAITVGATHGEEPHRYGVSYFSSRGPTADGRMKPDLVAPGEQILSCVPRGSIKAADLLERLEDASALPANAAIYRELSGTSMAAPHVSGAIAALLSVRREFRGETEKVKDIFVRSCTDLKRKADFQGAGLIDLMRAMQSV